jgi:hypothetical protein
MKRTLTLLLVVFIRLAATGQTVLFHENFDGMTPYTISGWGRVFSGPVPWQCGLPFWVGGCMSGTSGPMSVKTGTNQVACFAECNTIAHNDSNVFTYTPPVNLYAITGAWLRFDSYFRRIGFMGDTEKATLEISVDDGTTWAVIRNMPPNTDASRFETIYYPLAAYDHQPNVRIGYRYNDDGGNLNGWAIDNVSVFVPARKDLSILSVTPNDTLLGYVRTGTGYIHAAQVYNAGLDTVHSFLLQYRQGTGPVISDTITGVSLAPFSTTTIMHSIPDTILSQGIFNVALWAVLDSDVIHNNDTAFTTLRGAEFIPHKKLAIESGEGTYNGWSTRNMYYLNSVPGHDVDASLISIHEYDPMVDTPYHDFMFLSGWNYVPYIMFDRRESVVLDSFFQYLDTRKNYFAFADLSISGSVSGSSVTVTGNVKPAIDLHGDYRLALVITQDGVTGTDTTFNQVNNFAGGVLGPCGGYETMPNPIPAANMVYNYVARKIYPDPEGQASLLPMNMIAGNTYGYSLTTTIDPAWQAGKLNVTVLMIRHSDSTIMNSVALPFYLQVNDPKLSFLDATLYPNPAADEAQISFELQQGEQVNISLTDISGKTLYTNNGQYYPAGHNKTTIAMQNYPTGIYIVNIQAKNGTKSLKMEVIH